MNKIIKICCPIVQILIVVGFVLLSLPNEEDELSFVTNVNSTSKVSVFYGDFVSSDIINNNTVDMASVSVDDDLLDNEELTNNDVLNDEVIDVTSYSAIDSYVGTLTGYGPDCTGCKSGVTASGYRVAEVIDGVVQSAFRITYDDDMYGEVRILAAAYDKFPNGTIIRISDFSHYDEAILGIVMDTGATMRNAWSNGNIWIDLLFSSENDSEIKSFGIDKSVTFEVLRYGF